MGIVVINKNAGRPMDEVPVVDIEWPSVLANPYVIGPDGDRLTVMKRYRVWLHSKIHERDPNVVEGLRKILQLHALTNEVQLACHCAPAICHGDVIRDILMATLPHLSDEILEDYRQMELALKRRNAERRYNANRKTSPKTT